MFGSVDTTVFGDPRHDRPQRRRRAPFTVTRHRPVSIAQMDSGFSRGDGNDFEIYKVVSRNSLSLYGARVSLAASLFPCYETAWVSQSGKPFVTSVSPGRRDYAIVNRADDGNSVGEDC